jgi:hypothetical protein
MAIMPDSLRFTSVEEALLGAIQKRAKERHEKARRAAKKRGRKDFPMLPYECSWAFEQEFRRMTENERHEYLRHCGKPRQVSP